MREKSEVDRLMSAKYLLASFKVTPPSDVECSVYRERKEGGHASVCFYFISSKETRCLPSRL
ncbi:hypothetical protein VTL71DRAFT_9459 [Oculimacula yallundae]|uniref:Uncharacterized protein n=1 Tax=Oculimacula yallundae TaxID=86028 RepID=A0ABR4BRY7_9HELO